MSNDSVFASLANALVSPDNAKQISVLGATQTDGGAKTFSGTVTLSGTNVLSGTNTLGATSFSAVPTITAGGLTDNTGVSSSDAAVVWRQSTLTLTDFAIAITDGSTAEGYGGTKLFDFPAGVILIGGVTGTLAYTGNADIGESDEHDIAIGTTVKADDVADLTGTATQSNVIAVTAADLDASKEASVTVKSTASNDYLLFDGTSTAVALFLNSLHNTAIATDAAYSVDGTLVITWANLGDV